MNQKNYRNKEWLIENWVTLDQSMGQVARLGGCHKSTIRTWIEKFNIEKFVCECGRVTHLKFELNDHTGKRRKVCNVCRDNIKGNIKKRNERKPHYGGRQYFD